MSSFLNHDFETKQTFAGFYNSSRCLDVQNN